MGRFVPTISQSAVTPRARRRAVMMAELLPMMDDDSEQCCNASPDSTVCVTTFILPSWADFWHTHRNRGLDPGEGASPDSFFSSFRPGIADQQNQTKGESK